MMSVCSCVLLVLLTLGSTTAGVQGFTVTARQTDRGAILFNASLQIVGARTYKLDKHRTEGRLGRWAQRLVAVDLNSGVVRLREPFLCSFFPREDDRLEFGVESRQQVVVLPPASVPPLLVDYVSFPVRVFFDDGKLCPGVSDSQRWSGVAEEAGVIVASVALTRTDSGEGQWCWRKSQLVLSLIQFVPLSVRQCNDCEVKYDQPEDARFKVESVASDLVAATDTCIEDESWQIVVPLKVKCLGDNKNVKVLERNCSPVSSSAMKLALIFHVSGVDNFDNNVQRHRALQRLRRRKYANNNNNNKPPHFPNSHNIVSVPEEKEKGLVVTTVTANDPDQDSLTYNMLAFMDTRSQNMFKIDSNSGLVTTTVKLDREFLEMHVFRILAADNGQPSLTATTTLQINVIDENDHLPVFEQQTYETSIRESVSTGTTVVTVRATDQDSGSNAEVAYSIVNPQGANDAFRIDSKAGIVTTRLPLDREKNDHYKLLIRATDQAQLANRKSATATVLVTVLDDNDNYPQFSEKTYTVSVPEDVDWTKTPTVAAINATDADLGPNGAIRYSIIGGNTQGHFNIDTATGDVSVISALDYEGVRSYRLVIRAQDNGSPSRSNTTQLLINVMDVNDNQPRFYTPAFQESVTENVPIGTSIVRVQAYDADDGNNSEITYTIIDALPNMPIGINNKTGWITTVKNVDREQKAVYNFVVEAKDNGNPPQSASATVTIAIQDTNDNDPVFDPKVYEAVVSENDPPGTPVVSVTASDIDENPRITYQITSGNIRGRFSINSQQGQGVLTIAQPLDYKMEKRFILTVTASDAGGRSDVASVYINVSDANTHRPMFEPTPYSVTVLEDSPIGTTVLVVSATDGDVGENARITYSIDDLEEFQINPSSGAIVTAKKLDREKKGGYTVSVTAQDHGIPPLSDTTDVEIVILDVNDNAPVFTEHGYNGVVREDALIGTSIIQISATDEDQGLNGRIRYTFVGGNDGNGHFNIDPTSGIIRTDKLLDRETISSYVLTAIAVDRGTPPLSAAVNITISIEDVNDNAPRFESDRIKLFVTENLPIGSTIGEVSAVDPDDGPNAVVTYSIAGGTDASSFSLTTRGGAAELMTRTELDYESPKKKYELVIRAASPPLQNEVTVEVWVVDVNDNAPLLHDFRIIFNNFKNHFPTLPIGRVPAFDADVSDNLTYRFVAGNNANLLLLNVSTGEIKLSRSLNTNVPIQATMEVSVSDGINEVRAECHLSVLLVTDAMLFNSVTVRLDDMTQEAFLSPLFTLFTEGLAAIIPCPKENIFIFNVLDDTDVDGRILNVSFSAKKSLSPEVYFTPQYLMERVYLNRAILAKLATVKVLAFDDNLCVREPCPHFEECMSVLKFGNASGFIASNSIMFRPIYPVNTFACACPPGFTGMLKHYLCDTEVNLCYSSPCGKNGTCILIEGGYSCSCQEGFTGKNCEVNINHGTCSANVCRGSSRCAKLIKGGFICENCTTQMFTNRFCELHARRFVKGSFLTFPALRQRHHLTVKLSIATRLPNGLLLYNGRYNEKHDFVALEIVNGKVQFSFSLGTGKSKVVAEIPGGINDGKWHTITLDYFNRTVTLSIDDDCDVNLAVMFGNQLDNYYCANRTTHILEERCSDPTVTCHRFLDLTGPLQLGGLPTLPSNFQVTYKDFDGCIKDLFIDHHFIDFNSFVADNGTIHGCPERQPFCSSQPCQNGGKCRESWGMYICHCPSGFGGKNCHENLQLDKDFGIDPVKSFNGNSFLVFHTNVRSIQLPWLLSVSFRTRQTDALLVRIQVGQKGEAVLELVNGYLRYRINAEWLVLDYVTVNDGEWHHVELKWLSEGAWFILDYGHYEKTTKFETHVQGMYMGKVTVGGVESLEETNNPLNFKGCIQDVRIGNRSSSWLRPTAENNIEPGCQIADACMLSNSCPPNSRCTDNWGAAECKCLPGFKGQKCHDICLLNPCLNGGTCRRSASFSRGYLCNCDKKWSGEHCETKLDVPCPTNWFGSPICGPCQCDVEKGYDPDCNKTTGECYCKENHFKPLGKDVCYDCGCYMTGSFSKKCDPITGQCRCRSGVINRRCNSCSNPFAEVTLRGCEALYDACPRSYSNGMWWERTYFNEKAIQPCPRGLQGKGERFCDRDKGWQEAILFNCTSIAFSELRETLQKLNGGQLELNTYLTVKLSQDLESATYSNGDLHGDDLLVVLRLVTTILKYEGNQRGLNLTHRQDKDFIQNIIDSTSRILDDKYRPYWDKMIDIPEGRADILIQMFEKYSQILVENQSDTYTRPFESSAPNLIFGLDTISFAEMKGWMSAKTGSATPSFLDSSYPATGPPSIIFPKYNNYLRSKNYTVDAVSILIPYSLLGLKSRSTAVKQSASDSGKQSAVISYIVYKTIGDFVKRSYDSDVRQRWGTGLVVPSPIVTVNIHTPNGTLHGPVSKPVRINFEIPRRSNEANPQCAYWKTDSKNEGKWSSNGCEINTYNERHFQENITINCTCYHLSSYAILMDITDEEFSIQESTAENVVTYAGIGSSLLLLLLAFIVFCALRGLQTNSNTIHKNLTICVFLAELIFLIALKMRRSLVHKEFPCKVVAIFLHYFFLCEFSWMLLEAIHLYRMLTEMRDINHGQMRFYYALGYGVPAIVVGLAVGVRADEYGNHIFCWLSVYESVIWSLVGPICCIVVLNLGVFVLAIRSGFQLKEDVEDFGNLKMLLWLGIALLPLLGATWVLAVLAVNENVDVLYYFFTIFAFLQGLYIFLGYCVFNKRVRVQMVRTFAQFTGKKIPFEDGVTSTRSTAASKRSALAYHNTSFDILHRNIGISTSSTTSRSTCKTSSSPYRSDSQFRNTSTSTPSNFNSSSDFQTNLKKPSLIFGRSKKKIDDPDTGEVDRKKAESDSDSEASMDHASLDLASSHSSDEEDYSSNSRWEGKKETKEPNIPVRTTNLAPNIIHDQPSLNILSQPVHSSHWSSQGPTSFSTFSQPQAYHNQATSPMWQQSDRYSVNTASDNELPHPNDLGFVQQSSYSRFSPPMIDESPTTEYRPHQLRAESLHSANNDTASDLSSRPSSKLAAILSGQRMFVPPMTTAATDSEFEGE